jgi:putative peptidoglycan lipid II flippase
MKVLFQFLRKSHRAQVTAANGRLRAVGWVSFLTLVVALLGYVREGAFAARLAASAEMDAYVAAFFMPNALYLVVITGALAPAFIPIFMEYAERDREEAWRVFSSVLNLVALTLMVVTAIGMATARWWMPAIFSGFSPHTLELSLRLTYIIFPAMVFLGLAGLVGALLNSLNHFVWPAASPACYSLFVIPVLLLARSNRGIYLVAVATALGLASQLLIQLSAARKLGVRYYPVFEFRSPAVIKLLKLGMPLLFYLLVAYASVVVERNLASRLWPGALSIINYASRIFVLPTNLLAAPLSIVFYPTFAREAARVNYGELREEILKASRAIIFVVLPAAVWMMVHSKPVTRLFYERGQFRLGDSLATAAFLTFYCLGALPTALATILLRGFYSVQDTLSPLEIETGSFVFYVVVAPFLTRQYGLQGLALARALSFLLVTVAMVVVLEKRMSLFARAGRLASHFGKVLVASLAIGIVTWLEFGFFEASFNRQHLPGRALIVGLLAISGGIVYLALSYWMRVEEARFAVDRFASSLGRIRRVEANSVKRYATWEKQR